MCDIIRDKENSLRPFFLDGQKDFQQNTNLSNVLDGKKVSNLNKAKLKNLLRKPCFSKEDKSFIKELRRKYQCRQTSQEQRDAEKVLEMAIQIEIECLKWEKDSLEEEKECIKRQIRDLRALL
ncbi:hypothetical protein LOD99_2407 [Oopsacas minuta]|uniref:Uncharacterized protein n=1 Tax=Oopsacas minuta TaxID=111878 RepID=A0AAV7K2F7_9METZ|nr:hypothetical protein LOD99_2407 [Oopsacas minuta]